MVAIWSFMLMSSCCRSAKSTRVCALSQRHRSATADVRLAPLRLPRGRELSSCDVRIVPEWRRRRRLQKLLQAPAQSCAFLCAALAVGQHQQGLYAAIAIGVSQDCGLPQTRHMGDHAHTMQRQLLGQGQGRDVVRAGLPAPGAACSIRLLVATSGTSLVQHSS